MQDDQFFWEFSFDLYNEKVKKYYGRKSFTHGWEEIGKFLMINGFNNRDDKQYSCYFTSEVMSPQKASAIVRKLYRELPWVTLCIKKESLTIRQESFFSNLKYAQRLNLSKEHLIRLEGYYEKIGVENPLSKR